MSNLSLLSIMRDDPDFGKRISQKIQDVKKDKENLLSAADEYEQKYHQEILEGTELRNRLITEGTAKGLSESQILGSYGRFVPTKYTPVLNLLYFLIRESDNDPRYGKKMYDNRDRIDKILIESKQLDHDDGKDLTKEEMDRLLDYLQKNVYNKTKSDAREMVNNQFEKLKSETPVEDKTQLKESPDMVTYLYGNITLDTFNKIKKLKALSKSPNEQEAFQAYRKANELCEQYNLDFDRIPCYVKGQNE